jgi:hypothetical protein
MGENILEHLAEWSFVAVGSLRWRYFCFFLAGAVSRKENGNAYKELYDGEWWVETSLKSRQLNWIRHAQDTVNLPIFPAGSNVNFTNTILKQVLFQKIVLIAFF